MLQCQRCPPPADASRSQQPLQPQSSNRDRGRPETKRHQSHRQIKIRETFRVRSFAVVCSADTQVRPSDRGRFGLPLEGRRPFLLPRRAVVSTGLLHVLPCRTRYFHWDNHGQRPPEAHRSTEQQREGKIIATEINDEYMIVAICTPLMQRVHQQIRQSSNIVFCRLVRLHGYSQLSRFSPDDELNGWGITTWRGDYHVGDGVRS